ncbi:MAG: hypothetical protein ACTSUB_05425 [Candidatus Thorarchaeota archaeon]
MKVRDAIIHLLGLESTGGIDANRFQPFSKLVVNSVSDLQDKVVPIAIPLLKRQKSTYRPFQTLAHR